MPMPDMPRQIVLLLALLCPALVSASTPIQPVESIRAAVLDSAGDGAEIALDSALRMPRCGEPLQARRSSNGTVEVSCAQPSKWRLFVPVRIRRHHSVLVLARTIAAGETISANMLVEETRDTSRVPGAALSDPASAIGQIARRALTAGSVLTSGHLRAPDVVRRGDQVALVSGQGGIEVRMAGRALSSGGVGEHISVENLSSRRRVQGVVSAAGEVHVVW